ncbi:zinc finger and BTB domain-containing protein 49-like [Penaeus chinensis]|uniref:zinc finger and BTB domain-containing protein 49-like n=1 Tax=Penaeus chinensis TaxID=139456 RepID=UPI001FB7FA97|nr:zinc finger and BTB domain-containing protein 49-like [Penaeus chinensis]
MKMSSHEDAPGKPLMSKVIRIALHIVGAFNSLKKMSFFADWMPSALYPYEEISSRGVSVKEELSEDITEDTCLEIKEEPFDYTDRETDEMSDVKACNLFEDRDGMLEAPLMAEDCGNTSSSDGGQAMHKESLEKDTQRKVEATLNRFVSDVWDKKLSQKSHINIHMRGHTKEKPHSCAIRNKVFPSKSFLEKHIRVHTKEMPYLYEICKKAFAKKVV